MNVYDSATIQLMREVLRDAWSSLPPIQRQRVLQSDMASRILHEASNGERDPIKLREAALQLHHHPAG